MSHRHPAALRREHEAAQPIPVTVARTVAAAFGTWQFGAGYILLTMAYIAWNTAFHGPDPFPFMLYTMGVSVLAILMSNLILLATNYQERMERVHRENNYLHTDEILGLSQQLHALNTTQLEILELLRPD